MNAVVSPARAEAQRRRRAASRHDLAFARDVLAGLAAARKSIPGRWRDDSRGMALRDAIERNDAASPARLERSLLARAAEPIAAFTGAGARLLALGDDAPGLHLLRAAIERLGAAATTARRVLYIPGHVSATMPCDAALSLRLRDARQGRHDVVIIAASALRDPASMIATDAQSATLATELDRNVLVRIRHELGADLDPEAFDRDARFDAQRQCIETTLVSRAAQRARVLGRSFDFAAGEPIVVERAHQHCLPRFEVVARDAGWSHAQLWVDANARFAVHVLERS
jgi:L-histidine N-alpha-methyltransferase